jgi:hypothetical protein
MDVWWQRGQVRTGWVHIVDGGGFVGLDVVMCSRLSYKYGLLVGASGVFGSLF